MSRSRRKTHTHTIDNVPFWSIWMPSIDKRHRKNARVRDGQRIDITMIITKDCDHGRNRCLMSCMFWICGTLNQRFVVALFSKESTNAYEIYIQLKVNAKRSLCTSWRRRNSNKSVMKVKFVCGWLLTWFISIDKNVFSLLKMCKLFENMKQVFYSPLKSINTFFWEKKRINGFQCLMCDSRSNL